jgi:hypothetical protein
MLYHQLILLTIVKSIKHQQIIQNDDMQLQYDFFFPIFVSRLYEWCFFFQHKTIIDPSNRDLVHHLLMYECDPSAIFNDNSLPNGLCNGLSKEIRPCSANIATGWAVGGDEVNF